MHRNRIVGYLDFYFTLTRLKAQKIFYLFFRIYNRTLIILNLKEIIRFEGVNNIELASIALSKYLASKKIDFFKTGFKDIL